MNFRRLGLSSLIVVGALGAAATSTAQTSQLYELRITAPATFVENNLWDSSVAVGAQIPVTYTFDAAASAIVDSGTAYYQFTNPVSLTVGNLQLFTGSTYAELAIADNSPYVTDGYQVVTSLGNAIGGLYDAELTVAMFTTNASLLSSMAQPMQVFDASAFDNPGIVFGGFTQPGGQGQYVHIGGRITSYTITEGVVPEPATSTALVGAAALVGAFWRRRQQLKAAAAR